MEEYYQFESDLVRSVTEKLSLADGETSKMLHRLSSSDNPEISRMASEQLELILDAPSKSREKQLVNMINYLKWNLEVRSSLNSKIMKLKHENESLKKLL